MLGSLGWATAHVTGNKLDYCVLGCCGLYVIRRDCKGTFRLQFRTDRLVPEDPLYIPMAQIYDHCLKDYGTADRIMRGSVYGRVGGIQLNDLVLVLSAGVALYMGDAALLALVNFHVDGGGNYDPEVIARAIIHEGQRVQKVAGGAPSACLVYAVKVAQDVANIST